MADISIIEFGVYGFFAYTSFLMLIISTVKEVPDQKAHSIVRVIYLIPGIACAFILAGSGVNIITESTETFSDYEAFETNSSSIQVLNSTTTKTSQFQLELPIWISIHFLIGAVMLLYVIQQLLILLTKV